MWIRLLYLAAVFLIPLAPTIIVFKWLSGATATVKGQFAGFTISLGGAAAAYFLLIRFANSIAPLKSEALYTFEGYLAIESVPTISPRLWSHRIHAGLHVRRERIEPMEFRVAAEFEIDRARQPQLLRRQRPAAGAVEAPIGEAVPGLVDPIG